MSSKQATFIIGRQGTGKTTIARALAKDTGSFVTTGPEFLDQRFGMHSVMRDLPRPSTVIIDEVSVPDVDLGYIKGLLTAETWLVQRKGADPCIVPAANLIFCTGDTDFIELVEDDRRFRVIKL